MQTFISDLSLREFPLSSKISASSIRPAIMEFIQEEIPGFTEDHFLSIAELNVWRGKYISAFFESQIGELSELENTVMNSLKDHSILTEKLDDEESSKRTRLAHRVSDLVAIYGGSWTFVIGFIVFISLWMFFNLFLYSNHGVDPYPFVLLNLGLTYLATLQAPIIMMSQNRQEKMDRERSKNDYMINLKSELEIRVLHEKMDHLMLHQQQELLEIQETQLQKMAEILAQVTQNMEIKKA